MTIQAVDKTWDLAILHPPGDPDVGDHNAMLQRAAIKEGEPFRIAVHKWWRSLPKEDGELSKAEYRWLYEKLYFIINPDGSDDACKQQFEVDWEADCQGHPGLRFETFFDAMFQFVDLCCDRCALFLIL